MSFEWPVVPLAEAAQVFTGFAFRGDEYLPAGGGVRVVRGDNVTEHSLRWSEKEKCWPQVTKELEPFLLREGDVVVGMDGSKVGKNFAAVSRTDGVCLLAQRVARIRAKPHFDQTFLRYSVCNMRFTDYVRAVHTGTSIPHISKGQIERFSVFAPPIAHQTAVGAVLSALDERIRLLRETNVTLEAIAQALFKSWFIDIDPVRAKSHGLAPAGMDEATAALFPATSEDWQAQATRPAVSDLIGGGVLLIGDGYRAKNDELGQPGLPFVRAGDLDAGQITPTKDYLSQQAVKAATMKMAKPGDTAFTSKGTIGRFAFVDDASGAAVYSPQVCFWRSLRSDIVQPAYLHLWMKSAAFKIQVDVVRGQAAIMDYVSLADQRRMRLDLPPSAVQKRFAEVVRVLLDRISCNRSTAANLATLRDTLLPRLISGQLRLPEVEAHLQAA